MLTKRAQIPLKIGRIIELKKVECFQEEGYYGIWRKNTTIKKE